ncbi:MAG: tetratricopeptide repeat protein [Pseudomonadota bacterium]
MKSKYDDLDEYIADLRQEISQVENCANHQYALGMALLTKRDWVGAEEAFLAAVRNSPRLAEGYVQLGGICLQQGDLEGCLRYNEEAAQCRAKFPVPWSNIGFVHLQRGEPEKAISALNKALKWDPEFIQAMATLGAAHYMNGNYEACIKVSNQAITKYEGFAPAYNNLALAYCELGDMPKAIENVDLAIKHGFDVRPEFLKELEAHR